MVSAVSSRSSVTTPDFLVDSLRRGNPSKVAKSPPTSPSSLSRTLRTNLPGLRLRRSATPKVGARARRRIGFVAH